MSDSIAKQLKEKSSNLEEFVAALSKLKFGSVEYTAGTRVKMSFEDGSQILIPDIVYSNRFEVIE